MTFSRRSRSDAMILELKPRLQVVVQPDRCSGEPAAVIDRVVRAALLGEPIDTGGSQGVYVFHHGKLAGRPSLAAVDPPARVPGAMRPGHLRPAARRTSAPGSGAVAVSRSFPPALGDQG